MLPELIARYDQRVPRYTSYPTAPHFSAAVTPEVYAGWLRDINPETVLSLYVHVPFCAELCWYCGCHTTVARGYSPVAHYTSLLKKEMEQVARRLPAVMPVSHMHWGGGTPTAMAPEDLLSVLTLLRTLFRFSGATETAVEIDPRVLTPEHVEALAGGGVTRASLGVQDFDPDVQKAVNRIQPYDVTLRAVNRLREAGIDKLNLDLMYGLPHQTTATVEACVDRALTLAPDRIALFGYAHVPWMKKHQNLIAEQTLPKTPERVAQMEAAARRLEDSGYIAIGIDHFAKPGDAMARFQAEGRLHRNFQGYTTDDALALIGFGASAIGFLPQGYVQNTTPIAGYLEAVAAGGLATARGVALSDADRLRRAVIERLMCDFYVDLDREVRNSAVPDTDFSAEIARVDKLSQDGIVI
ncbi:MAG: oxygen-independent coproporphyrinogen III oxidase, partial [Methylobacteriaceae bacterium]|nr:oxygen-independent coproporphyrinogen III oxidase [Methylobacteriaceae bacterium]